MPFFSLLVFGYKQPLLLNTVKRTQASVLKKLSQNTLTTWQGQTGTCQKLQGRRRLEGSEICQEVKPFSFIHSFYFTEHKLHKNNEK